MAKKTWELELGEGKHLVELEHGYWSGKRTIRVDDYTIVDSANWQHTLFDTGSVHEFNIGNHPCAVVIRTNGLTFSYDLAVDGYSVTTGQPLNSIKPMATWVWILIATGTPILCCVAGQIFWIATATK
jgi:hypothetical protein